MNGDRKEMAQLHLVSEMRMWAKANLHYNYDHKFIYDKLIHGTHSISYLSTLHTHCTASYWHGSCRTQLASPAHRHPTSITYTHTHPTSITYTHTHTHTHTHVQLYAHIHQGILMQGYTEQKRIICQKSHCVQTPRSHSLSGAFDLAYLVP